MSLDWIGLAQGCGEIRTELVKGHLLVKKSGSVGHFRPVGGRDLLDLCKRGLDIQGRSSVHLEYAISGVI